MRTRYLLPLLVTFLSLTACGGQKGACRKYCDMIIDCGAVFALEEDGYEDCEWTYGEDAAHDSCMRTCENQADHIRTDIEGPTDKGRIRRCLRCVTDEVGDSCRDLRSSSDSCDCSFIDDNVDLGVFAAPGMEPMTCDSGEHFIFAPSDESGELLRRECLGGDEIYCQ